MKKISLSFLAFITAFIAFSQPNDDISPDASGVKAISGSLFTDAVKNPCTAIKDQERTNTCWSFATTSLIESQTIKNKLGPYDLSEMFTVRNMYLEKARNYILRQGHAQFSEGGMAHDVLRAYATYGAMPEKVYSGLVKGEQVYDHVKLYKDLKRYVDSVLKSKGNPLSADWVPGFTKILDAQMGVPPAEFVHNGIKYLPQTFAKNALKFKADDYMCLTSFTHHPFYYSFIPEVPDNFSNGSYYNIPLGDMITSVKSALASGYTVLWDADVSNNGFNGKKGMALLLKPTDNEDSVFANPDYKEEAYNPQIRQQLFENLTTQDDHLMHIVGIEKSKGGKTFFIVKNSWGDIGPYGGYVHVSEAYFAVNTIGVVVPKSALDMKLLGLLPTTSSVR